MPGNVGFFLEHDDGNAGRGQLARGCKPDQSGPDDADSGARHRAAPAAAKGTVIPRA